MKAFLKKSMRCKFLQDIYLKYFIILELAGSNLADTAQSFQSHTVLFIFVKFVSVVFVNAENVELRIESFS